MDDRYICDYCDLPGVKNGRLRGPMSRSATEAAKTLAQHRATSAAADYGAIMVWTDDTGGYRASMLRSFATVASGTFTSKRALLAWLKAWWPAMRDPNHGPEQS